MVSKSTKVFVGALILIVVLILLQIFVFSGKTTGNVINSGKTIKIGWIGALTGDVATVGINARDATALAVEQINAAGGINGKALEVIYEDGKCSSKVSADAMNKLANIDRVPVVIGGLCSGETLGAAPIAESTKTVMVSPCSSSPEVTNAGDYIFRDYPSDSFLGKVAAEFAYNKLGKRKAALLYAMNDWSLGIKINFEQRFKELGGEIVAVESFEDSTKDLRTQLTKIKAKSPDMIFFTAYTDPTLIGLKQAKELGLNMLKMGGDTWGDSRIAKEAGSSAEGMMWLAVETPLTEQFKTDLKNKIGSDEIGMCTPTSYDAVKIIADIMKKVGTNSEAIKNELYTVKNYNGVSGVIGFDENGDLTSANYVVKTIKNGKAVDY